VILHYVVQHIAKASVVEVDNSDVLDLQCATVVLQHSDGRVGFDRGSGAQVIRAMVRDVVVIEAANAPEWTTIKQQLVSSQSLHSQFRRVLTCSGPHDELLRDLQVVSSMKALARKNELLARHGRARADIVPTMFDDWISAGGRVRGKVLAHLVDSCWSVAFWLFADWGLYARLPGRSVESATAPILQASQMLGIPVRQLRSEAELPAW
jgi:hypothetical protein